jgi:Tfp pilus assembly protein PilV
VQRAFTLVEVLVTTMLVAVAVVSVLSGIRAIEFTDLRARNADLLQRLAAEKMNDLRILPDPGDGANSGTFSDRGYGDITWTDSVTDTGTTGVEQVTVTTTRDAASQSLTTLMFVPSAGDTTP